MRKVLVGVVLFFVILSLATVTFAAPVKGLDTKLGRGTKNVLLGWTELPKNIASTSKEHGALVGITVGTIKGIFQTFARTVSGAVDVLTFPMGTYDTPAIKPSMLPEKDK